MLSCGGVQVDRWLRREPGQTARDGTSTCNYCAMPYSDEDYRRVGKAIRRQLALLEDDENDLASLADMPLSEVLPLWFKAYLDHGSTRLRSEFPRRSGGRPTASSDCSMAQRWTPSRTDSCRPTRHDSWTR